MTTLYGGDENDPANIPDKPSTQQQTNKSYIYWGIGAFVSMITVIIIVMVIFGNKTTIGELKTTQSTLEEQLVSMQTTYCNLVNAFPDYNDPDCPVTSVTAFTMKIELYTNPDAAVEVLINMKSLLNKMKETSQEKTLKELDIEVSLLMAGISRERYKVRSGNTGIMQSNPADNLTEMDTIELNKIKENAEQKLGRPVQQYDVEKAKLNRDNLKEEAKTKKLLADIKKDEANQLKLAADATTDPVLKKKIQAEARAARSKSRAALKESRVEIARAYAEDKRAKINQGIVDPTKAYVPELSTAAALSNEVILKSEIESVVQEFDNDQELFDNLLAVINKPSLDQSDQELLTQTIDAIEVSIPIEETVEDVAEAEAIEEDIAEAETISNEEPVNVAVIADFGGLVGHLGRWTLPSSDNSEGDDISFIIAGNSPHKIKVLGSTPFYPLTKEGDNYVLYMSAIDAVGNPNTIIKFRPVDINLGVTIIHEGVRLQEVIISKHDNERSEQTERANLSNDDENVNDNQTTLTTTAAVSTGAVNDDPSTSSAPARFSTMERFGSFRR